MDPLSVSAAIVGLHTAARSIESILTASLTAKKTVPPIALRLVSEIAEFIIRLGELKSIFSDLEKGQGKWASEDKVGLEGLYEAAETVLNQLCSAEDSGPFLKCVNNEEAPDYSSGKSIGPRGVSKLINFSTVIREPMDLGTITKKLSAYRYKSKGEFVSDLNLIWANCLKLNTNPEHPLRKKALIMRKETEKLIPLIPDVITRDRAEIGAEERRIFDDNADSDVEPIILLSGPKSDCQDVQSRDSCRKVAADVPGSSSADQIATKRHSRLVDDIVVVLSACVLFFSELNEVVEPLKSEQSAKPLTFMFWKIREKKIEILLAQIESNRINLSLIIRILRCNTILETGLAVNRLQSRVSDILKNNVTLLDRLENRSLSNRPISWTIDASYEAPREGSDHAKATTTDSMVATQDTSENGNHPGFSFDEELKASGPYRRAMRKVSAPTASASSAGVSFRWTFVSGRSVAGVYEFSLISILVSPQELSNSKHYTAEKLNPRTAHYANRSRGASLSLKPPRGESRVLLNGVPQDPESVRKKRVSWGEVLEDDTTSEYARRPLSAVSERDSLNPLEESSLTSSSSRDVEIDAFEYAGESGSDSPMDLNFIESDTNSVTPYTDWASDISDSSQDQDILRPTEWIMGLKAVEMFVLERSYLWSCRISAQKHGIFDPFEDPELGRPRAPRSTSDTTNSPKSQLPFTSPSEGVLKQWGGLQGVDDNVKYAIRVHKTDHKYKTRYVPARIARKDTPIIEYEYSVSPIRDSDQEICASQLRIAPEIGCTLEAAMNGLLRTHNTLILLYLTVEELQKKTICTDGFSFFVQRESQLVLLRRIRLRELGSLISCLNYTIQDIIIGTVNPISNAVNCSTIDSSPAWEDKLPFQSFLDGQDFITAFEVFSLDAIEYFWSALGRILDLALISYCGAHVVSATEHYSALERFSRGQPILIPRSPFEFAPRSLQCMGTFLKGKIWALGRTTEKDRSAASMLTSIDDLADVWGPIWKLPKSTENKSGPMGFYVIGGGAIGAPLNQIRASESSTISVSQVSDIQSCHFTSRISRMEQELKPIALNDSTQLLIGTLTTRPDFHINPCLNFQFSAIEDIEIRPHGTAEAFTYKDSMTFGIQAGYQGVNVLASSQYKLRHAVTRKERLQTRWMLQPQRCSLRNLNLWIGLEVSICTRNARRRKLYHLLGSQTIQEYIKTRDFEWSSLEAEATFFRYVGEEDMTNFMTAINTSEEYLKDVKRLIAWILELLMETGLESRGDLSAFAYMSESDDPEKIAIFARKRHSWAGFLKDTTQIATFAIATELCLSFPYRRFPGQHCRNAGRNNPQYSVLQTAIVPKGLLDDRTRTSWRRGLSDGARLPLTASKTEMLKVLSLLPNGHMIVRWSTTELARSLAISMTTGADTLRFYEQAEEDNHARRTAMKVYITSKHENKLPHCRNAHSDTTNLVRGTQCGGERGDHHECNQISTEPNTLGPAEHDIVPAPAEVSRVERQKGPVSNGIPSDPTPSTPTLPLRNRSLDEVPSILIGSKKPSIAMKTAAIKATGAACHRRKSETVYVGASTSRTR